MLVSLGDITGDTPDVFLAAGVPAPPPRPSRRLSSSSGSSITYPGQLVYELEIF